MRCTATMAFLALSCWARGQSPAQGGDSFRFAVIGDSGTGGRGQYEVGEQLAGSYRKTPFPMVVMLGDNIYGRDSPANFQKKFELPYKLLLDSGVQFYAALGNHDSPERQLSYPRFNMGGRRYYTFQPRERIRFFALDSSALDQQQVEWFKTEAAASGSDWKIAFFHHPIYSSGARHGSDLKLRALLEPLFVKYGVNLVLSGHDHFYERMKPQQGILYFVLGGAGKVRKGNVRRSEVTAEYWDRTESFALMEIDGDALRLQVINREGETVDKGSFRRRAGDVSAE
jgi:3',5'-cyclic AMP phosphodiesterase CpdA